jgi:carbamoyl-phosphate synthase large subunit
MSVLLSCVGRRGYIADYFRPHLSKGEVIVGTANTPWNVGFKSCDVNYIVPAIGDPEYIPSLLKICEKHDIRLLLSFLDGDIGALAAARSQFLDRGTTPLITSDATNAVCLDKWNTFCFLKEHGFNCPTTYKDLDSVQNALNSGDVSFPLIVKPRKGSASINVFTARNQAELEVFFGYAEDMIVQPKLTAKEYGVDVCSHLTSDEVLAVVIKHKVTMRSGETDQAIIVNNPKIEEMVRRLAAILKVPGPLDIDILEVDGTPYILEMNPRFGGGYPLSHLAGANFPAIIMAMVRGEPIPDVINKHRRGVVAMKYYEVYGGPEEKIFGSSCIQQFPLNP